MRDSDFKINKDGLIMFDRGDIDFVHDFEQTRQHIQQRLNTFLGEWPYNIEIGIPYFDLFEKPIDLDLISYHIKKTIQETPGVASIVEFTLVPNEQTRVLAVKFKCLGDTTTTEIRVTL